jgi:hypothetical protein
VLAKCEFPVALKSTLFCWDVVSSYTPTAAVVTALLVFAKQMSAMPAQPAKTIPFIWGRYYAP